MMKRTAAFLTGLMMITGICTGCGTAGNAVPLNAAVNTEQQSGREPEKEYAAAQMKFGTELFRRAAEKESGSNMLISPFSVYTALAMTSNGATEHSLEEFREILGGGMEISDINEYTASMINRLNGTKAGELDILNSVWFADAPGFKVNQDFLDTIGSYYSAEAFKTGFDAETVKQANKWVSKGTNGMIKKLLDESDIDEQTRMMLLNSLYFNCRWQEAYENSEPSEFTSYNGEVKDPQTLFGTESTYYEGKGYTGFAKPYNGGFSFVGLLPDKGTDIEDFIASLDPEELAATLAAPVTYDKGEVRVFTSMPVLKMNNRIEMQGILGDMGMEYATDSRLGDINNIAAPDSAEKDFYISKVIHSAAIEIGKEGTEAAAATTVVIRKCEGAIEVTDTKDYYVYLDRPYVYMIIDDETGLPLFMGAVLDAE